MMMEGIIMWLMLKNKYFSSPGSEMGHSLLFSVGRMLMLIYAFQIQKLKYVTTTSFLCFLYFYPHCYHYASLQMIVLGSYAFST